MILANLIGLLPALLFGSEAPAAPSPGVRIMTIERQVTIRVPVSPRPPLRVRWEESEAEGPQCLPARALAGAMLSGSDTIDFVLRNRRRLRARLDTDCPALDFYGGFYVQPEEPHRICAQRDVIHNRVGASCRIERFRTLIPKVER